MAVTKRSVKGLELTQAEMDANWDELIGLLTRLSTFTASQTPGANNILVLDSGGILKLGSYIVARPAVTNCSPMIGDRSRTHTMIEAAGKVHLSVNCYFDGTNWISIAAGAAYAMYISATDGGVFLRTANPAPTAGGQTITWSQAQIMTVPAAASWQTPTLLNNWAEYSPSGFPVRYAKDGMSIVRLKGSISAGTIGSTVFTLPSGYRPVNAFTCAALANVSGSYAVSRIQVGSDGNVTVVSPASVTYVSLDNIAFATY